MIPLPRPFIRQIQAVHGARGQKWLEDLPALRASLLGRWSLQDTEPIRQLSYNYLEFARTADGSPVVLKIGVPNPELETEIRALAAFAGKGAVRLIDADPDLGALLLERVIPGTSLSSLEGDEESTRIAGAAMGALWIPDPGKGGFPTAADWCRGYGRYQDSFQDRNGPLPEGLVDAAQALSRDLLGRPGPKYLLHGDLHHGNILDGGQGTWIVIDPKGVIAEPAFEVGPFLYNPLPDFLLRADHSQLLDRRLAVLAEVTGQDRALLAAWSFCRAVLSAIWSVEDGLSSFGAGIHLAEHLQAYL